uniref:Uncharacterized protein n=1 Tax=Percolomonas cosmopolitus TaxID=63605 RepID=A0A7S1PI83_9EUKA|mmetsp:Transcript_7201/g.26965  ORF Transcript_7201/g.26965 Transcript_7201/m.26965 type:complete len:627 (+) Transcript_7201:520-2400(+)|eukprot:CAMPEP_0117444318 /NCGR_PEP_ID=MMETSP0759-20121206/5176_1 /TAXON_ID=63605 /ORGANISM="Percolomonas cosmopolitus, Strain WS" /LENGTH=626 /DNA_ID=CAMNT_0005236375 /DNA_START=526 /DNA_END=2406 /DNA_ORIENTATION=+
MSSKKASNNQRLESVSTQALGNDGATISHYKIQQPSAFQFTCFTENDMEALYGGKKTTTRRKLMKQKRLEQQQKEENKRKTTKSRKKNADAVSSGEGNANVAEASSKNKNNKSSPSSGSGTTQKDTSRNSAAQQQQETTVTTRAGKAYNLRNNDGAQNEDHQSTDSDVQVVPTAYAGLASYSMDAPSADASGAAGQGAVHGGPQNHHHNGDSAPHAPHAHKYYQDQYAHYGAPPPQQHLLMPNRHQMRKRSYDDTFHQEYQDNLYQQQHEHDTHSPYPSHLHSTVPPPHYSSQHHSPQPWQRSKSVPTIDERQAAYFRDHPGPSYDPHSTPAGNGSPHPQQYAGNGTPPNMPPHHMKNRHTQNVSTVYDRRLRRRLSLTEECDPEDSYPSYASGRRYSEDVSVHSPVHGPNDSPYNSNYNHPHHHLRRASMPSSTLTGYSNHHVGSQYSPYPHVEQRRSSVSSLIGPGFRDISLNEAADKSHEEWFRQYKRPLPHVDETLHNDLAKFKFGGGASSDSLDESADQGVVEIKFDDDPDLSSPRTCDTVPSDEIYEQRANAADADNQPPVGAQNGAGESAGAQNHNAMMGMSRRRSGFVPDLNPPPPEDTESPHYMPPKLPSVHELLRQ